jgi:hypothetical protein
VKACGVSLHLLHCCKIRVKASRPSLHILVRPHTDMRQDM